MNPQLSRRTFCRTSIVTAAGCVISGISPRRTLAVSPFDRPGTPRLRLSLAAYSFREFFNHSDERHGGKTGPSGRPLDMFSFVDYCAEHGCEGAELTSYYFPPQIDEAYLLRLKQHAFIRGVTPSGGAVGNVFTHPAGEKRAAQIALVRRWVDYCAVLGAAHIRIFAGEKPKDLSLDAARRNAIEAIEEAADYAGRKGIFLGVENHGGIVGDADGLLAIVEAVKSPWVGINLDTGNFNTEDPFRDLARCAPYAVNVQFKVEMHARGAAPAPADVDRVLDVLRRSRYQGFVALEYESPEDPWTGVPKWLGKLREAMLRH